ncbi:PAS domain S-box protein [bacterium]|nr:PAS domain S-box protein [bacterium]
MTSILNRRLTMGKACILIAESDADAALALGEILRRLGYQITAIVETGQKVLERVAADKPDLVLLDTRLKENLEGVAVADIIQTRWRIPVVFVIDCLEEAEIERSLDSMPFGYFRKPIQEPELKLTVAMALHFGKTLAEQKMAGEMYRSIFLNSKAGLFIADIDTGLIIDANDRVARIAGFKNRQTLLATPISLTDRFIDPEACHKLASLLKEQGDVMNFEARFERVDQKTIWISYSASQIPEKSRIEGVLKDITDQKQAEQALQESEYKYRTVIEHANEAIVILQGNQFKYFNYKTCELTGYSEEDLRSKPFLEFVHPDDHEMIIDKYIRRQAVELLVETYTFKAVGKRGNIIWAEIKPVIITWESEVATLCFISDISERILAEEAKQESEEKFRQISDQSLLGIAIIQNGVFKYVNEAISRYSEHSVEEMMGWKVNTFLKLVHPDDLKFVINQFRWEKSAEKGYTNNYTYRGLTRSGKTRWIEQYSKKILYAGKNADLVTVIDITQRKQAEEALRDSEEKYRKVVDNAIEAICVVQDGRFAYFNPEAVRLFGYSKEALLQVPYEDTIYPEDRQRITSSQRQRERGEHSSGVYSHRIVTHDGSVRWVDVKAVTITWNAHPGSLIFMADITDRKRSEELMIQSEKMMSMGTLAAGMAHELNNPLGGILQGAQNVLRRLSPELTSNLKPAAESGIDLHRLQSYLDKRDIYTSLNGIRESGRKASQIIANMLQFSRKSESRMAPTNLAEVMEKVLELAGKDYNLKKRHDFRSIRINKVFDPNLPLVPCTETEIEQVVLNLVGNAAQAMSGIKQDDPPQITLRLLMDTPMARMEIIDNGPGMAEAVRKRIFEPFFTTKPVGEGPGLGLSVSYMIIVNNHQGSIEVESQPGKGTRFIIKLPLDRERIPSTLSR